MLVNSWWPNLCYSGNQQQQQLQDKLLKLQELLFFNKNHKQFIQVSNLNCTILNLRKISFKRR